jgi:hypothetical protein
MDYDATVKTFFLEFLELIMRELENNTCNSDLTNRKIKYYSDFIYENGKQILNNNDYLSNYISIFYLQAYNHNLFGKVEYCVLSDSEKMKERSHGSREKYSNIPMDYHIHDAVNCVKKQYIPILVDFFSKNIELFEKLHTNMELIE